MNTIYDSIKKEYPFFLASPAILWQVFFLYIPLCSLVLSSFMQDGSQTGMTLYHYSELFSVTSVIIIARSALLSLITALGCLCIAYPLVYYLIFHVRRFNNFLFFLLMIPFWTSYLILLYAWFFLLEPHGVINSLLVFLGIIRSAYELGNNLIAVQIVMIYCYLPFMIMPLYTALEKFERKLLEASADLGATAWQTFVQVTIPLSVPGIRTGLLLVLVSAFGEFAIPTLIGGSRYMTVGSLISYYFLIARDMHTGAAFTIIAGIVLSILAAVIYLGCNLLLTYKAIGKDL